ncbi:glycosyltransferase family 2 protein [Streptomyces syringium]|uniref:glycosyltransferase family 2 protein n=1 Tax=Streptomyces syringium TaxID=76729 RepID=UPI00340EA579
MALLETVVRIAALSVVLISLSYALPLLGIGMSFARRPGRSLRAQLRLDEAAPAPPPRGWTVFALVPCLNEERVISNTVRGLLEGQPGVQVIVIDDGSDDATAGLARAAGDGKITVVRRTLPRARQGKGPALNAGLAVVRRRVEDEGLDPGRVLVCVVDADGRMTPAAAARVAELFDDPAVGGVQLAVRIRDRRHWSLRFQDIEFWTLSALTQFGRVATGSVSMGGNGQFTRLAALDAIGPCPWSDSLTEDLDLGISLAVHGWTLTSTPDAYVSQQGLTDPRSLLRQRTRWFQGHMSAITRLPELWTSPVIGNMARAELTMYLLIPYLVTLPWSVAQQYLLLFVLPQQGMCLIGSATEPPMTGLIGFLTWYLASFGICLPWALLHWRRSDDLPLWKAVAYSHAQVLWSYVGFIACWRATWRIAARRRGWTKTERAEDVPLGSQA